MAITKIGSRAIEDGTVAAVDFAPGTVSADKLAGSIGNDKLANNTITVGGTSTALGASSTPSLTDWQSVVVSDGSTVTTMVAGRGYFVNNSSAAGIVKLPASANAGDTIRVKDYAGNFGTNNLTIQRNSHKIQGNTNDSTISTDRASLTLVYVDATKGWLYANESNVSDFGPQYIAATGGTATTSGDYKIHTFTGDGNFVVSSVGSNQSPSDSNDKVAYLVVAGGGGGNNANFGVPGGAGGAGGYREAKPSADPYSASPIAATSGFTVSAQTYPITVGGAGGGGPSPSQSGSNSVFSTITSTGGGGGGVGSQGGAGGAGGNGGSGGGGGSTGTNPASPNLGAPGSGNTPPVSPSQGNNGGQAFAFQGHSFGSGGGGGATAVGDNGGPGQGGAGGAGATSSINGTPTARAGGGGGGGRQPLGGCGSVGTAGSGGGGTGGNTGTSATAGSTNTGGGGGGSAGSSSSPSAGQAGGSGIVIIRYKYQN
jgi:hypothetical protein